MYNTDRTIILTFQVMHSKVEITYSKRSQVVNQGKYFFLWLLLTFKKELIYMYFDDKNNGKKQITCFTS